MTYTFLVNTHFKGAVNGGTTPGIDTSSADLIVLGVVANSAGVSPTDSNGNTWSPRTIQVRGAETAQLFYCQSPIVGAAHTFSVAGTSQYPGVYVLAFRGSAASPYDVENGATLNNSPTFQPGSITPSIDNELVVAFESDDGGTGLQAIDSGFVITDQELQQAFVNLGASMAYLIQTTAGAVNPTWTVTGGNRNFAGVIASFKSAGVIPPGTQMMSHFVR